MSAVRDILGKMMAGQFFPPEEWILAIQEAYALGWCPNETRPEEPSGVVKQARPDKKVVFPWWTDPVTGEDVRGPRAMFTRIVDRERPGLTESAGRVVEALEKRPDLMLEVYRVLGARVGRSA